LYKNFTADLTKKGNLGEPMRGNKGLGKILFDKVVKKVGDLFLDFDKQVKIKEKMIRRYIKLQKDKTT